MSNRQRILWITRTAIFIALLIAIQALSRSMGQYVTGSLVNLVLVASVMLGGLATGITVAALSNFLAFFLGIGPQMLAIVPFVAIGNIAWILAWHFVAGRLRETSYPRYIIALIVGAAAKFAALYLGIVLLAVPVILALPEPQASAISLTFSYPQLITAAIGGAAAVVVVPLLRRALAKGIETA